MVERSASVVANGRYYADRSQEVTRTQILEIPNSYI
jgi:hypothetical protein